VLLFPVYVASHPHAFALFSPSFEGSRRGLGSPSSLPANTQQLPFYKQLPPITNLESTLLEVFILRNLKPPEINSFRKTGRGVAIMVNQLLETSHPLSSSAPRLRAAVTAPSFHSPYLLQSSVSRMSCICHSYAIFASRTILRDENTGGGGILPKLERLSRLQGPRACPCYHRGAACASTEKASLNDRAHP